MSKKSVFIRFGFLFILCGVLLACMKQPESSVLFYNNLGGGKNFLGANKTNLGPHDGLLGVRSYYFPCGSTVFPEKYQSAAKAQALYLKAHPHATIQIQGFDDARGSANYALVMGQARADSVSTFMRLQGVSVTQLMSVSYGSELNAAYNGTAVPRNCRVDIVYMTDN